MPAPPTVELSSYPTLKEVLKIVVIVLLLQLHLTDFTNTSLVTTSCAENQ